MPWPVSQLPDYHDIIKHPMDFGTIRKKLADGAYSDLEKFEVRSHLRLCRPFLLGFWTSLGQIFQLFF